MFQQVLHILALLHIDLPWGVHHIPELTLYSGWASDRELRTKGPGLEGSVQVPRS